MEEIKKILTILSGQIHSQALSDALAASNLSEVEWSEEDLTDIESQVKALMTTDAAIRSEEVIKTVRDDPKVIAQVLEKNKGEIKANLLHAVREELVPVANKLGVEVKEEDKAFQVIQKLAEAEAGTGGDEQHLKTISELQRRIKELNESSNKEKEELAKKLEEQEKSFATRELKNTWDIKMSKYNWAVDEKLRKPFLDSLFDKTTAKVDLKLEEGNLIPFEKGTDLKYQGGTNKEIPFDVLVEPDIKDFLKKQDIPKPETHLTPTVAQPTEKEIFARKYKEEQSKMFAR